jgi:hypothetical protein
MTHEHTDTSEASGGPEHDQTLPNAEDIPVSDGPFDLEPEMHDREWEED